MDFNHILLVALDAISNKDGIVVTFTKGHYHIMQHIDGAPSDNFLVLNKHFQIVDHGRDNENPRSLDIVSLWNDTLIDIFKYKKI